VEEVEEMEEETKDVILQLFHIARRLIAGLPITMLRFSVLSALKDIGSILLFVAHHVDLALSETGSPIPVKDTRILSALLAPHVIGIKGWLPHALEMEQPMLLLAKLLIVCATDVVPLTSVSLVLKLMTILLAASAAEVLKP
jgi:hypothetical protein